MHKVYGKLDCFHIAELSLLFHLHQPFVIHKVRDEWPLLEVLYQTLLDEIDSGVAGILKNDLEVWLLL